MQKFFYLFFIVIFVNISSALFAEETEILEEIVYAPPNTLDSDYIGEPEITIRKEGANTVEEHRINGNLYMIKVTPKNFPPYYLVRESQGGDWLRMDDNKPLVVPQWVILSF